MSAQQKNLINITSKEFDDFNKAYSHDPVSTESSVSLPYTTYCHVWSQDNALSEADNLTGVFRSTLFLFI